MSNLTNIADEGIETLTKTCTRETNDNLSNFCIVELQRCGEAAAGEVSGGFSGTAAAADMPKEDKRYSRAHKTLCIP